MTLVENAALIVDGKCWFCRLDFADEPRPGGFLQCPSCGREFLIEGRRVTERIILNAEWRGKTADVGPGRFLVDGAAPIPVEGGSVTVPRDAWALEVEWEMP